MGRTVCASVFRRSPRKVDGKVVATLKMKDTLPSILEWDENLDVGSDTGTPEDIKKLEMATRNNRVSE